MARTVSDWVGKNDDHRPPPRVIARIFQRENGVCHISGRKIRPGEKWEADHKIAIINGGKNCESNLFPALVGPHKAKTKIDVAEKAKTAAINGKHIGAIVPKGQIKSAPMPTTAKAAARISKPPVVRQYQIYRDIEQ